MSNGVLDYALVNQFQHLGFEDSKGMNPFQVADMALTIQIERTRAIEAIEARDIVVARLATAYASIRQKTVVIEELQTKKTKETSRSKQNHKLQSPVSSVYDRRNVLVNVGESSEGDTSSGSSVLASVGLAMFFHRAYTDRSAKEPPSHDFTPPRTSSIPYPSPAPESHQLASPHSIHEPTLPKNHFHRHDILADLPVPKGIPEDALRPIILPSPFTLHEFLASATGPLRDLLCNYRIVQEATTCWCPEREEHGYIIAPAFKCSTNPRTVTAHRWTEVDVIGSLSKPTAIFFLRQSKMYYAGTYKAWRMDDFTTAEWEHLSTQATQSILKDTLIGRKNTSPQNIYEVSQLYSAGALKVACVALQCVGFNNALYRLVLDQATKWRGGSARWPRTVMRPSGTLSVAGGTVVAPGTPPSVSLGSTRPPPPLVGSASWNSTFNNNTAAKA